MKTNQNNTTAYNADTVDVEMQTRNFRDIVLLTFTPELVRALRQEGKDVKTEILRMLYFSANQYPSAVWLEHYDCVHADPDIRKLMEQK